MSTRPLLSARTAAAISLARRFIGWGTGRLFAYLYVNSAFWAKARSMTPGSATTAAVLRRRVRRAVAMVLSWRGLGGGGGGGGGFALVAPALSRARPCAGAAGAGPPRRHRTRHRRPAPGH